MFKLFPDDSLADPRGDAAFNLALSRKRCNAVVDYLKKKGVLPEVITMEEKGATNVSMDDSAALRESRRAEFTLIAALAQSA
jgi:outer membrane protein OmpA-like peptidoglycan-associated protein